MPHVFLSSVIIENPVRPSGTTSRTERDQVLRCNQDLCPTWSGHPGPSLPGRTVIIVSQYLEWLGIYRFLFYNLFYVFSFNSCLVICSGCSCQPWLVVVLSLYYIDLHVVWDEHCYWDLDQDLKYQLIVPVLDVPMYSTISIRYRYHMVALYGTLLTHGTAAYLTSSRIPSVFMGLYHVDPYCTGKLPVLSLLQIKRSLI